MTDQKQSHTPGPWTIKRVYSGRAVPDAVILETTAKDMPWNDPVILAVREDWLRCCEPDRDERSLRMSADLRLIAAAPAMYEALVGYVATLTTMDRSYKPEDIFALLDKWTVEARAALAMVEKEEGR